MRDAIRSEISVVSSGHLFRSSHFDRVPEHAIKNNQMSLGW